MHADRTSIAQILLLVDEASQHYLRFRNPQDRPSTFLRSLLSAQTAEMGFVGPYDTALLSDLASLDTTRYKLVLVLNALRLDTAQRNLIHQRLTNANRTVIWFHAPGYFDEHGSDLRNIERLTGIHILRGPVTKGPATVQLSGSLTGLGPPIPPLDAEPLMVDDSRADALGRGLGAPEQVLIARRQMEGWTSIYTATAPLPAAALKRLAADAGVHIYDESPSHLLFANRNCVMLAANEDGGEALIRLPQRSTVNDSFTEQHIGENIDQFAVPLRPKEVRVFSIDVAVHGQRP